MVWTAFQRGGYIGAAKQSSQGTSVAPTYFFRPIGDVTVEPMQEIEYGRDGNVEDITYYAKNSGFHYRIKFKARVDSVGAAALLAWALGADSVSGGGDPYTHAITLAQTIPWLSIEAGKFHDGSAYGELRRCYDAKIRKLSIKATAGKQVEVEVEAYAMNAEIPSAATVTYQTEGPLEFGQCAFTLTAGPDDYATIAAQILGYDLTIDRGLEVIAGPNSFVATHLFEGGRKIDLELDFVFISQDADQVTYFGGSSGTGPSRTTVTGSVVVVGTLAASPAHDITITTASNVWDTVRSAMNPDRKLARMNAKLVGFRNGSTYPISASVRTSVNTDFA